MSLSLATCFSSVAEAAEVRWLGSEECRRELEVVEQLEAMTQAPISSVQVADFELEPRKLDNGGFELTLVSINRTSGAREQRVLQGASCAEVTDAAAVAIALTIGAPPRPSQPTTSEAPPPAPPSKPRFQAPDPPRPDALAPRRSVAATHWAVGLSATFDSAVLPHPVPGGALQVALGWRALRGELEVGAFAPSSRLDADERGGTFQLMYLAPRACAAASLGKPVAALCLAYELGRLSAEGQGVQRPYARAVFWHAVRPELGLAWPLGRKLWLAARAGGAVALARDSFVLDAPEIVHRPAWLSLRAALGVELEL